MTELYIKGPVLSPGLIGRPEMGLTDRPLTPQEIQKAAYTYTAGTPIIDVQHNYQEQGKVVESYIAPEDTQFNGKSYPAGTWFVTSRITDPILKESIHKGELTGYSVGAWPEGVELPKGIIKGMFSDVDEGKWMALAVSIVKMPFYPEMIFKVFKPDEFIKKSFNPNTEVNNMNDEDKGTAGILNKVIDYFIDKNASAPQIETPQPEITLEDLNQTVQNIQNDLAKLRLEDPKEPEAKPEPETAKEVVETKPEEEEDEEVELKPEEPAEEPEPEPEKVIKKSIDIDEQTSNTDKSFMEKLGRDAFGNKL